MSRLTESLNKIQQVKTSMNSSMPKWKIEDLGDRLPTAELVFDIADLEVSYDKNKEEFCAVLDFLGGHYDEVFDSDITEAIKGAVSDFLDFKRLPKIPQEIIDKLYKGEF